MGASLSRTSSDHWRGCIMAIDGWVCVTRKPFKTEVHVVMKFRNRKSVWGIVVLAGCGVNLKFHMWSCTSSGSTNDIMAWRYSSLRNPINFDHLIERINLIDGWCFLGNFHRFCMNFSIIVID